MKGESKMKKLLFAVSALAALSLLAPSSGFAQHVYFNQVGLYTTSSGLGTNITGTNDVGVPVSVFLVLSKPAQGESVFPGVKAFECQLNFNPIGNIFKLGDALAADGLNIGDTDHIADGYLEYIVGFSDVVALTADQSIALVSFTFMNLNVVPVNITLGPPSVPSIPGQMAFLPPSPPLVAMYSAGGAPDAPVFTFNGQAVAVENESFGAVKALYR
jgi:hypothetical protein